jgi:chromosome segregation ATPase
VDRDAYLLVGLVGALLTFIGAAWKFRGSVNSSEAGDLWRESASMRSALQGQLDGALSRVTALETRINELEARDIAHERQALEYRRTIDDCQRQNAEQALTIRRLEQQVNDLQTLVKTLQGGAA